MPSSGDLSVILVTALLTAVMTLVVTRVGNRLLAGLAWPIRAAADALYASLAPLFPEFIGFATYRRRVRASDLAFIETPIQARVQVPLRMAYAPLRLLSAQSAEPIDLFERIRDSRRIVVLGGPGTGKTTLMKSLIMALLERAISGPLNGCVPVMLKCREIATRRQSINDAIVSALKSRRFAAPEKFVDACRRKGRILVVLDGLDEVSGDRSYVANQILEFCRLDRRDYDSKNRIVVTCREQSYEKRDLDTEIAEILRVEPFSNHHMRTFLSGWPRVGDRHPLDLLGRLQQDPQILAACRNPLLLTILVGIYLETEHFALPTSRERFYDDALRELLLLRPGRRNIPQTFPYEQKIRLLGRLSLERLEHAGPGQDPEIIASDSLQAAAIDQFGQGYDRALLVGELVDVNGVLKRAEADFTFLHRTIQEYLAAREARRLREPESVVAMCRGRSELSLLLNFYCGLLTNVPDVRKVFSLLAADSQWLQAGQCLANAVELPEADAVEAVSRQLLQQSLSDAESSGPAIEALSAMSQRRAEEFSPARRAFEAYIDSVTAGDQTHQVERALSLNPETARRVYPGLLRHTSVEWQRVGVHVLRDLGTDESLDELVSLLSADGSEEQRTAAALALAKVFSERPWDLASRAELFPQRSGKGWQLERYFPGQVAMSLAVGPEENDDPILRAAAAGAEGWTTLSRDLRINKLRKTVARGIRQFGLWVGLLLLGFVVVARSYSLATGSLVLIGPDGRLDVVSSEVSQEVAGRITELRKRILAETPLRYQGWARLVRPWRWTSTALEAEGHQALFDELNRRDVLGLPLPDIDLKGFRSEVAYFAVDADALFSGLDELHRIFREYPVVVRGSPLGVVAPLVLGVALVTVAWQVGARGRARRRLREAFYLKEQLPSDLLVRRILPTYFAVLWTLLLIHPGLLVDSAGPIASAVAGGVIVSFVGGAVLEESTWPRNPLFRGINDSVVGELALHECGLHPQDRAGSLSGVVLEAIPFVSALARSSRDASSNGRG